MAAEDAKKKFHETGQGHGHNCCHAVSASGHGQSQPCHGVHDHEHDAACHSHHGASAHSHHHHGEGCCLPSGKPKLGILLAMFGTTVLESQRGYDILTEAINEKFPQVPVFRSYTADKVRRKMKRLGREGFSVSQALYEMYDQRFTHVAVQSVHTIPGLEFEWMSQQALAMQHPRKGLKKISLGQPLLTEKKMRQVVERIPAYLDFPRGKDEAVVLVGHGAYHPSQVYYHALQSALHELEGTILVGTLMGSGLDAHTILRRLEKTAVKKVHLVPFMGVPGHHFDVDMMGPQEDSWVNILQAHGYACASHKLGTAGSPVFRDIWLNNLEQAIKELDFPAQASAS